MICCQRFSCRINITAIIIAAITEGTSDKLIPNQKLGDSVTSIILAIKKITGSGISIVSFTSKWVSGTAACGSRSGITTAAPNTQTETVGQPLSTAVSPYPISNKAASK